MKRNSLLARCVTNSHGRLLEADSRFCKLIGLEPADVPWRYMVDFYRQESDWVSLCALLEKHGEVDSYILRLRHRKGRAFRCLLRSVRHMDEQGRIRYVNEIQKLDMGAGVSRTALPTMSLGGGVVYLTACHACGKVKDAHGEWLEPMQPVRPASSRKPCYCPHCSSQLFPGILDSSSWDTANAL